MDAGGDAKLLTATGATESFFHYFVKCLVLDGVLGS
jgi:hypothetical protein